MIKQQLLQDLKKAVLDLGYQPSDIVLSIPEKNIFGDYSTNIALQLAKQELKNEKQTPMEIAKEILSNLGDLNYLSDLEIKEPGFINFFIKPEFIKEQIKEILTEGEDFGKSKIGNDKKIQVEFISANPTGPLTLAGGRGGALGDTLANVLDWSGFKVEREYYVNDTGNQIRRLGDSVLAIAGKVEPKEEHYQGEYVKELAEKFKDKLDLDPQDLGHLLADYLLENEIKPAILRLGIKFDEFYSERSLYEKSLINKTADLLKEKGAAYEGDGALWFKSTDFGDEKDRVLMTSEEGRGRSEPTYFMADIAHHIDVLSRGYVKRINILGADHHGYAMRIKGAVEAAGFKDKVDIIFMQMVKLFQGGKEVKMSKRAGTFVALDDLLKDVSSDAVRFFFLMYAPNSHIDFNLDLAKEQSNKNPVFYIQYAYARMNNILEKAKLEEIKVEGLDKKEELELIKHLTEFPDLIEEISMNYQVQSLVTYTTRLADLFHHFYESSRVLQAETPQLQQARLALVQSSKVVLGNALKIMGITAPERM